MRHLTALLASARRSPRAAMVIAAFAALCLWAYWPALADVADRWQSDPQYSHGYLVPAFALVLLYLRRDRLATVRFQFNPLALPLLAAAAAGYVAGAYLYFDWLSAGSFLLAVAGLFLLLGGKDGLRWAWPAVAFLAFMIPLPYRVGMALGQPLQRAATLGSTWLLQTAGLPAIDEGNVIVLNRGRLSVVEACNGLSMLMIFVAIGVGLVLVVRRPLVDKAVILLSTVPIAVFVNVLRITSNGVATELWGPGTAETWFHDQAGWLMMPAALGLLGLELWVIARLFPEAREEGPAGLPGLPRGFAPIPGLPPRPAR